MKEEEGEPERELESSCAKTIPERVTDKDIFVQGAGDLRGQGWMASANQDIPEKFEGSKFSVLTIFAEKSPSLRPLSSF